MSFGKLAVFTWIEPDAQSDVGQTELEKSHKSRKGTGHSFCLAAE
jgi:hypothetical protein